MGDLPDHHQEAHQDQVETRPSQRRWDLLAPDLRTLGDGRSAGKGDSASRAASSKSTKPASGSAHHQPSEALRTRPTRTVVAKSHESS